MRTCLVPAAPAAPHTGGWLSGRGGDLVGGEWSVPLFTGRLAYTGSDTAAAKRYIIDIGRISEFDYH